MNTFSVVPCGAVSGLTLYLGAPVTRHPVAQIRLNKLKCLFGCTFTIYCFLYKSSFTTFHAVIMSSLYYKRLCLITIFYTKSSDCSGFSSFRLYDQLLYTLVDWYIF